MAASPDSAELPVASNDLSSAYQRVRKASEQICQPLLIEDYGVQTIPMSARPNGTWRMSAGFSKPLFLINLSMTTVCFTRTMCGCLTPITSRLETTIRARNGGCYHVRRWIR